MGSVINSSPLFQSVPDQRRFPIATGQLETDVIVVGAGVAGVMTAWNLAARGLGVMLLEQNHVVSGDTGFTTSFVVRAPDTSLAALFEKIGAENVKRVFEATTSAEKYLRQLVSDEHIACDWVDCNAYNVSYQAHNPELQREWSVLQPADPQTAFVTAADDPNLRPPQAEAIRYQGEAHFNVRKFLIGLLSRPGAKNIQIFEESKVNEVSVTSRGVTIKTDQATIAAKKLVDATGWPGTLFPEIGSFLTTSTTYAIAAQYESGVPFSNNTFWDTDLPYQYYRRSDDQTVILGGADRTTGQTRGQPHQELERFLTQRFGPPSKVTHHWSGSLHTTTDGLALIGAHPLHTDRVFIATGFNGSGMIMGTLSGLILGDLVAGRKNPAADLFSLERLGPIKIESKVATSVIKKSYPVGMWLATLLYAMILCIPGYIFFAQRGGFSFLQNTNFQIFNTLMFPLVGLYAFTLLWSQFVIGAGRSVLRKWIHPNIITFHRRQGVLIFLLAWLHPTMRFLGLGFTQYFKSWNVSAHQVPYLWLGYFQLFLITITVITALLRKLPILKKHWHLIHYLNYVVFVSVWVHSWFLGTDVRHSNLRYLWIFFALTAIGAAIIRWRQVQQKKKVIPMTAQTPLSSSKQLVTIAQLSQVTEGNPFCAVVNNERIAVMKFGPKYYAIENTCSHAGGSLCEGIQMGNTIECPLHQSVFDITSGAVKEGPAIRPQKIFPVTISGDNLQIEI